LYAQRVVLSATSGGRCGQHAAAVNDSDISKTGVVKTIKYLMMVLSASVFLRLDNMVVDDLISCLIG
jgi:hypothetical protein